MAPTNFWEHAPSIGWAKYLWRKIVGTPTKPNIIPVNPIMLPMHVNASIIGMNPDKSDIYVAFLEKYFYTNSTTPTTLKIPSDFLAHQLRTKNWIGVEYTDGTSLLGLVLSKGAGHLGNEPCGIVDYLCVHPSHRKTGIASRLLHSLYAECVSVANRYVQFFVKEGFFSLLPPVKFETVMAKRPQPNKHYSVEIKKLDRASWVAYVSSKINSDPDAIILQNYRTDVETELYVACHGASHVIFKPNFEYEAGQDRGSVSIIDWWGNVEDIEAYEIIANNIPYDFIYVSSAYPHHKSIYWQHVGVQTTYVFHLDPGCPFERAVYSPLTA